MSIAYYRGTYKLSKTSCIKTGCSFVAGEGGPTGFCTNFPGVLSNREIKQLIKDEGITPYFNQAAMVKYFIYASNSWVGSDDAETYALKEAFADDHCLGGICWMWEHRAGMNEAEGSCIERATASDYIHNQMIHSVLCELRCQADRIMIWSIDFDKETGLGLGAGNEHKSPQSATINPMAHTTVSRGQTFTLGSGAATDVPRLLNNGNQNSPQGPGASKYIPLPPGFVPPRSFTDPDSVLIPANQPLPRETTIPEGIIFTEPFLIAPSSSLREGEGEDQASISSDLIWLPPEIWNDPNPQVQCFFPCIFVLPPYTSYTGTVDYPQVTVTESGMTKTTLTFPPLTVSSWAPNTIVVGGRAGCTTTASCTDVIDNRRTFTIDLSRSSAWPFGPPKSTATPCAWPTLTCTPGPGPDPGTGPIPTPRPIPILPPGDTKPKEEDEEEQEEICLLQQSFTRKVTRTVVITATSQFKTFKKPSKTSIETSTKTSTKQPEPTLNTPDWTQNKTIHMITTSDQFCEQNLKGKTITEDWNPGVIKLFNRIDNEVVNVEIIAFVEALPGCKWKVDVNKCKEVFRDIIDNCDTNGENRKQVGRWENNCLKWRLDPNANFPHAVL
ncbi:hypothetical protein EK21DRAFT_86973 [Setomelanomma holmii]|uniref:Uncharacterized protein n=1 Tax=Setomelanomma holmii TaxID=210430 RepID=A0A9P4HDC7_9PLEO|nr:hypothetical protein EK21DRAFT_86973 [Setomelanomma holmii]